MRKKKSLVIFSYYHFPCDHPVLENVFAKELAKDFKVTFLFQGDLSKGAIQKWHNSQIIITKLISGNSFKVRLINKLYGLKKFIILITLLKSNEIVLVRDLALETIILAILRRFFRYKLYFQYSAPIGDIRIGYFKNNKTFKRYWYLIHGYYYNLLVYWAIYAADLIIPITTYLYKESNLPKNNKDVIPLTMGFDNDSLKMKHDEIDMLKKLKKSNYYILTYFGTINYNRNPEIFLEILSLVIKDVPNCVLLLMGKTASGYEKRLLQRRCDDLKLNKNVIFTGLISRKVLQDHLQYCDISISAVPPESYYRISSPTKLYESLGNGLPVVANEEIYEQKKVIMESGGGLLVKYDAKAFSAAILQLLSNKDLRIKIGRKGKEYINKHYSYQILAKNLKPYLV